MPGHRLATGQHRVGVTGGSIGPVGSAAPLHVTPRISCPFRVTYLVGHVCPPLSLTFSVRCSLGVTEVSPSLSLTLGVRLPLFIVLCGVALPFSLSVTLREGLALLLCLSSAPLSVPLSVTECLRLPSGLGHPCRNTQSVFDKCVQDNMGMERPYYGYFCAPKVIRTNRPRPAPEPPLEFPNTPDELPDTMPRKPAPYSQGGGRQFF
ncbi:hypothetical protein FJT64_023749 [Amphibalanus amphitrite]|uniref:Uncharacterized protein n=1 Tax=Amphibalanus amphitrite TaxID=1232801 RepID=A0A6A4WPA4_AMPAM|nr:hypothetical protein FJT64_023749 [Amphibalanus amphitrite]